MDDPRIEQLKRTSTKDLVTMFIGICRANPDGDEDWKELIRNELKERKDYNANISNQSNG